MDAYQMCKKAPKRKDILRAAAEKFHKHSALIKPPVGRPMFRDVVIQLKLLLSEDDLRTVSAAAQTLAEYNSITVDELGVLIDRSVRNCANAVTQSWDIQSKFPLSVWMRASENSSLKNVCKAIATLCSRNPEREETHTELLQQLRELLSSLYDRIRQGKSAAARRLRLICPLPQMPKSTCVDAAKLVEDSLKNEELRAAYDKTYRYHLLLSGSGMGWGTMVTQFLAPSEHIALSRVDVRLHAAIRSTVVLNGDFKNLEQFLKKQRLSK